MSLNKEQLSAIQAFVNKKGIHYLDVQMEILDHVASAVEEKMSANAALSFEEALKQTHVSFGIFGFGGVEDSIVNAMNKKYNRIFWKTFGSFFNYKCILLVGLTIFLLYQLQVLVDDYYQFLAYFLGFVVLVVVSSYIIGLRNKQYKNLLVYKSTFSYFSFFGSGFLIFNYLIGNIKYFEIIEPQQILILSSVMLVLFIIYIIAAIKMALLGFKESKLLMDKYHLLNK
ncbi:MAG: hypothetical protein EOP00_10305 [Pedobacter sp.]|nr:MAG: hypothetical protein EOP00_10305 [Pedobacter sp.]